MARNVGSVGTSVAAALLVLAATVAATADTARTVTAPELAIRTFGAAALKNSALQCSSAKGGAGAVVVPQVASGGTATIAGATANGAIALTGSDGTARTGSGALALGAAATWSSSNATFNLGAGSASAYVLDVGAQMPASESAADAMFDAAFGSAARYGVSLSRQRSGPQGKIAAFYNTASEPVTIGHASGQAAIAVGVVMIDGRVKAVQIAGTGDFAQYAK